MAATAVMSLANPFGGALGQLIDPFLADEPHDIPSMVLIIAIIVRVISVISYPIHFSQSMQVIEPNIPSQSSNSLGYPKL